jgi:transketolase
MSEARASQYDIGSDNIRQLFGETLAAIGREEARLLVLDCQTAMPTAASIFATAFPDRFIDLGIAEQNAVSFAAGLARVGFVPVVPLFGCFLARRALDQATIQVAYPHLNVKLCGVYAGLTSPNTGATHQMLTDLAIMRATPHLTVVEPADGAELVQALRAVVAYDGPVYLRLVRGDIGGPVPRVSPDGYRFRLGRATLLREGRDVSLVGSGLMVSRCLEAADLLQAEGISADVINVSTIKPLDGELLAARAGRTGAVVTAENHTVLGGLGSAVAEALADACPVPIRRVGVQDAFGASGPLEELFPRYGLTADAVAAAARAVLTRK